MSKFKVGYKVVCTAKERPDYFVEDGRRDYMLDRKAVLEVGIVDKDGVWVFDKVNTSYVWFLRNEDIELYALQQAQAQAVIINKVKDTIEELKALVAKVPTTIELQKEVTEEVECPECGREHEVEVSVDQEVTVPQLNNLWADLEKAISDLDYYILAEELKAKKQK